MMINIQGEVQAALEYTGGSHSHTHTTHTALPHSTPLLRADVLAQGTCGGGIRIHWKSGDVGTALVVFPLPARLRSARRSDGQHNTPLTSNRTLRLTSARASSGLAAGAGRLGGRGGGGRAQAGGCLLAGRRAVRGRGPRGAWWGRAAGGARGGGRRGPGGGVARCSGSSTAAPSDYRRSISCSPPAAAPPSSAPSRLAVCSRMYSGRPGAPRHCITLPCRTAFHTVVHSTATSKRSSRPT